MIDKKITTALAILAAALAGAFIVTPESGKLSASARQKLDPRLQIVLQQFEQRQKISAKSVEILARETAQPEVGVLVQSSVDPTGIVQSLGGTVGSSHGNVHTARVPIQALPALAENASIQYLEASIALYPELVSSVPRTGAAVLHDLPDDLKLTGRGVLVGITDTGIDWRHQDFKNPDGTTRILYIWDQFISGFPPAGFNYGVEYNAAQINSGAIGHSDDNGHGTHVASIAAGNGRASGRYIGMAPEADIIMVRGNIISPVNGGASTGGFLDGYAYIRQKSNALGKRHVINSSFGTTLGPHDGTTLYELAMNNNVAQGTIITNSAGNYATANWHAEAVLTPGGEVTLLFNAPYDTLVTDGELQIDLWYETNDRIEVEVASPTLGFHPKAGANEAQFLDTADGNISILNLTNSPLNGDNQIFIQIDHEGAATNRMARGTWRIRLLAAPGNSLPDGGQIDAWTERDDEATFGNFVDIEETINYPSTADSVIAVASFENGGGALSSYSSRGPRRDGVMKPDIAATGGSVIAARSSTSDFPQAGDPYHTNLSGTSMSAPHVCGAIALMLQADPSLTPAQVRKMLYERARGDNAATNLPNSNWGHGKLDVLTPLLRYVSTSTLSGKFTDEGTGEGINAEITLWLQGSPFDEPFAQATATSASGFALKVMPGNYTIEVVSELPYPSFRDEITVAGDSVDYSLQLEPPQVVIINDDPDGRFVEYYTSTLDSLSRSYAFHNVSQKGPVPEGLLPKLSDRMMIWYTGNASSETLSAAEQSFISSFLDQGGRLFLTGQNIAESLAGTEFLSNRIHASFVGNVNDFILHGVQSDVIGHGLQNMINAGNLGANNQTSRDVIAPDALAHAVVVYDTTTGTVAGIRVDDPANHSRLVFFSFGFEAVNRGAVPRPGYVGREEVLANVLAWFSEETAVAGPESAHALPDRFALQQSHPNPLTINTQSPAAIQYQIPAGRIQQHVSLRIYDLLGREVRTLVDQMQAPGIHAASWDGRDRSGEMVAAGVYLYRIEAGDFRAVRKMIVVR